MGILDLIFPIRCLECGKKGLYICKKCISSLRFSKGVCIECEKPAIDGMTHVRCKKPLSLDGAVSVWIYEKAARKAIITLKYKFVLEIAKELAYYISKYLKENIHALPKDALLTSVPLYTLRKNWRGFNQASEVGKLIAVNMEWEFHEDLVVRKKQSRLQTELSEEERRENIRGVFSFNNNYRSLITESKPLIIFDDVWTTGATLKEVAKVLKKNRVKKVWGLTIAR